MTLAFMYEVLLSLISYGTAYVCTGYNADDGISKDALPASLDEFTEPSAVAFPMTTTGLVPSNIKCEGSA